MNDQSMKLLKENFYQHVCQLQDQITERLHKFDSSILLKEDLWDRDDQNMNDQKGGGGKTRFFSGQLIENAGVNTSQVYGKTNPELLLKMNASGNEFWATGISLIIHPRSPKIPTVHANFRMLSIGEKWWFGGGADLTPYYPYPEDFQYFHQIWKKACEPYSCYQTMKEECDRYFVNHHRRGEMRGIGGIFFDHLNSGNPLNDLEMVKKLSNYFIDSYFPIAEKRKMESWNHEDESFQLFRRGRYVEFNLLHDRGTLFGLKTNGRTESILISLPHRCEFSYQYKPPTPVHEEMMNYYWPKNW